MDQPGLDVGSHASALRGLRRINALSFTASILLAPIRSLARSNPGRVIRVLDVASGGGDNAVDLAIRAAREGLKISVDGCDINPGAVAYATGRAQDRRADVRFFVHDALGSRFPDSYDVLICSLFLHHLDEADAEALLRRMPESAPLMVLVDDLIRSPLGYALAWTGCRLLSRSPIVRHDGPVSVAGAFNLGEIRAISDRAGLTGATVVRHWPERYLLTWKRDDAGNLRA